MATNRLYHKTLPVKCLTHTARTNGTVTGDTVDKVQGTNAFNSVLFVILTASLTDGVHTISVQARIDTSTSAQTGSASAMGTVGKGAMTVESVRLIRNEDVAVDVP